MTFKHDPCRPSECWIVVVDRASARILAGEWPEFAELHQIDDLSHPEGAAHQRDVESDSQGRFYEAKGPKHKAEAGTDFKHKTALAFAREIVERLEQGEAKNSFGRLVLIAPPLFLGVLRETLPDPIGRLVVADLDKDLTAADVETIKTQVQELLSAKEAT